MILELFTRCVDCYLILNALAIVCFWRHYLVRYQVSLSYSIIYHRVYFIIELLYNSSGLQLIWAWSHKYLFFLYETKQYYVHCAVLCKLLLFKIDFYKKLIKRSQVYKRKTQPCNLLQENFPKKYYFCIIIHSCARARVVFYALHYFLNNNALI